VTLLKNRLVRPLLAAVMAAALVSSASAQTTPAALLEMLQLYRPSPTGSYLAGRQAMDELRTEEAARFFKEAVQSDWDNPILVERSFVAFAANGDIREAAQTAKRLIDLAGPNELAELVMATEALKERRYGAAERALQTISQDTFTGITASMLRAWALVGEKRFEDADKTLTDLGSTGLEDFLVFHRALMAEVSGRRALALELAEKAFDNEPYVARMVEVYSRMLGNEGRFDEASDVIASFEAEGLSHPLVTAVKQAVDAKKRPGVFATNAQIGAAEMYHGIGAALTRDGSKDLALVFLRLGQYLDPSADVISLAIGQLLDSENQHEAANAIYDGIAASSPMKPVAVVRVAQNLDAMGERAEALRRLRNIVAVRPDDLDAVSVLGDLLRYDEEYLPAAEAYTKALEISGGEARADWRFYYVRGISYERAKEWPKAEADFKKALDLNPDQPSVLNYLGYSWIDMEMNLDEALGMIEKAVEAQPQDGYIIDSLGWAFYKLDRIDEAVETLERAVMLLPNDPEINDHLGDAYWKAGRKLEAEFQWNVAKSVDEEGRVTERVEPKLAEGLTTENETE
jgi:tetratricopeptide (TPR) repeat protein